MKNKGVLSLFALSCILAACTAYKKNKAIVKDTRHYMADSSATKETVILFYNLKKSAEKQVLFGHMEDNMNGYSGWTSGTGKSDVYDVTGVYPAMYGFDFGPVASLKRGKYSDEQLKHTHDQVIEAYQRHGVITFSWHCNNPVSKGSFYWKDSPVNAVSEILPGGAYNKVFAESLTKIADFANNAKYKGKLIPIIFRPWHEFDGDWFWWGRSHCSIEEYKALYRYTVTYLRDTMHVTNFLYAWSPDCNFKSRQQYTERYPGNAYVDVLGMDDYSDLKQGKSPDVAASKLQLITNMAAESHKIAAFTETGLENIPQADWYTTMLLKAMKQGHTQLAYVMVWSNRPKSYWTPYKGHPAEADFVAFKNDPLLVFGDKAGDFYKLSGN
ncbi:glycosyl hydrolase [uncultured Mucilaginibacter sp.]|uniref:glycoside hydrolase family 26 protein n=1 Tax=uncultured Mucilaginibacter sp. TaxID=797541 RepID=UPI0025D5619E|nr:glycosyl hydrolase [uncultured Mucilaginibacter sp.]